MWKTIRWDLALINAIIKLMNNINIMRYFIVSLLIVALTASGGAVFAQNDLGAPTEVVQSPAPDGTALGLFQPDSPLYFLQQLIEWIRLRLTFDPLERAKYELTLMERRAEEIRDLAERGRLTIERAQALQRQGEALLNSARQQIEAAKESGLEVRELAAKMQTLLERQQSVLQGALEHAPEEAQNAIQRAIEVSRTGKERALEILERIPMPDRPELPARPVPNQPLAITPPAVTPIGAPPAAPGPIPSPLMLNIIIEADDDGLYPATVSAPRGSLVTLTFVVRRTNVYFGGLDFRSAKFNVPQIRPGERDSVTFLAKESFSYASWWPASNIRKAEGRVNVE